MSIKEISAEINSLQNQIDDNEKNFDIALQDPHQLEYAKQLYRSIKLMESRLAELSILLSNK
jgi:hypothetical protein